MSNKKNHEVEVKETEIQEVESAESEATVKTPETQEQKLTVIDKAYGKYCAHREKVAEKKANRKPMSKEAKLGIGAAALALVGGIGYGLVKAAANYGANEPYYVDQDGSCPELETGCEDCSTTDDVPQTEDSEA